MYRPVGKDFHPVRSATRGTYTTASLRVRLTEDEQKIVNYERFSHLNFHTYERILVIWLLHSGLKRRTAAEIAGVGRATVQRYVGAFR